MRQKPVLDNGPGGRHSRPASASAPGKSVLEPAKDSSAAEVVAKPAKPAGAPKDAAAQDAQLDFWSGHPANSELPADLSGGDPFRDDPQ
jgi:hypothetical protein